MTLRTSDNLILKTDSYKLTHHRQYPPGTERVYSYMAARSRDRWPDLTFFGLQYVLQRHLDGVVVTQDDVEEAAFASAQHFGDGTIFNRAGWELIVNEWGGRLPLRIDAVPEGMAIPVGNALATVVNTDARVPWLTNAVETLLVQSWYPTTVATQSMAIRALVLDFLERTGTPALLPFKVHDFGFRGASSTESAGVGACAHLVAFRGTDTLAGVTVARDHYGEAMAGHSIPAAEHSTITSWGEGNERAAFANMLAEFPTGAVAVVSDSYDVFHACSALWGGALRDEVLARDGVLVVRPDSGDPAETVVRVLHILGETLGHYGNHKGYRVLEDHVRVIQGDGIDHAEIGRVLSHMEDAGWSADNVAFGSGGGLLQRVDRDMLGITMKCSAVQVNGEWRDVRKAPATDPRKASLGGRLDVRLMRDGQVATVRRGSLEAGNSLLRTVLWDGDQGNRDTLSTIRQRAGTWP